MSRPVQGSVEDLQRQVRRETISVLLSTALHVLALGGMFAFALSSPSAPPPTPPVVMDLAAGKIIPLPEGMLAGPLVPGAGDMALPPPPDDVATPPAPTANMAAAPAAPSESAPVPAPPPAEEPPPAPPPPPEPAPEVAPEAVAETPAPEPEPDVQPKPLPADTAGAPVKPPTPKPPTPKPVVAKTPPVTKPLPKVVPKPTSKIIPKPFPPPRVLAKVPAPPAPKPLSAAEVEQLRTERIRRGMTATNVPNPLAAIAKQAAATSAAGMSTTATDANAMAERIGSGIRNQTVTVGLAGGGGSGAGSRGSGNGGGAGGNSPGGANSAGYFDILRTQLYQMWKPNRGEDRGGRPRVIASLTVLADGTVREAHVSERSRSQTINASVEALLRGLRRLPAPSQFGFDQPSLTIQVVFEPEY